MFYEPPPITLTAVLWRLAGSVIGISIGVLIGPTVAVTALIVSLFVLLYCAAGSRAVQQRIPDLGRMPGVQDYRLYELVRGRNRKSPDHSKKDARSSGSPRGISRATFELVNELTRLGLRGLAIQSNLDTKNYMISDDTAAALQSLDLQIRSWATAVRSVLGADAPEFVGAFDAGPDLPPQFSITDPEPLPIRISTDQLSVFLLRKLRNLQSIKDEICDENVDL